MKSLYQTFLCALLMTVSGSWNPSFCKDSASILNDSYGWKYLFKAQNPNWNHYICAEFWSVGADTVINGKTYRNLLRDYDYIDGSQAKGLWDYQDEPYATGIVISLREETGRVFVPKEQYIKLLGTIYPDITEPYLSHAATEDELLLYDFTLHEGDLYPCLNQPQITKITSFKTLDNITRNVFYLSNGLIIVEGIGCINSLGTLVLYQNQTIEYVEENTRILSELIEYGPLIEPYIINNIYDYNVGVAPIQQKSFALESATPSTIFDLQGRPVSGHPQRGLYIQGGRIKARK